METDHEPLGANFIALNTNPQRLQQMLLQPVSPVKSIFARHRIPDEVVSDNVPPNFIASNLATSLGIGNFNPTLVQTVKNLLEKAEESGRDAYLSILVTSS